MLLLPLSMLPAAPALFASHPLGLFWFFKYPSLGVGATEGERKGEGSAKMQTKPGQVAAAPPPPLSSMNPTRARGIGLHADPAAVNINIWLAPDDARVRGGGLDIFAHVPPREHNAVHDVNKEFASAAEEAAFREELAAKSGAGGLTHVPYRCNRAAIFVSDQYHVSEPFEFRPGYANHRVNLTLLFGDRIEQPEGKISGAGETVGRCGTEAGGRESEGADDSTAGRGGVSHDDAQQTADALFDDSSSSSGDE